MYEDIFASHLFEETGTHAKNKKATENNLIVRSLKDPNSRSKAIHAQCFMCIGGTEGSFPDPGWRKDIGECRGQGCCLNPFRPYQKKESPTNR
jgi:hypothetical protein